LRFQLAGEQVHALAADADALADRKGPSTASRLLTAKVQVMIRALPSGPTCLKSVMPSSGVAPCSSSVPSTTRIFSRLWRETFAVGHVARQILTRSGCSRPEDRGVSGAEFRQTF